jgi:hypothetical protein
MDPKCWFFSRSMRRCGQLFVPSSSSCSASTRPHRLLSLLLPSALQDEDGTRRKGSTFAERQSDSPRACSAKQPRRAAARVCECLRVSRRRQRGIEIP